MRVLLLLRAQRLQLCLRLVPFLSDFCQFLIVRRGQPGPGRHGWGRHVPSKSNSSCERVRVRVRAQPLLASSVHAKRQWDAGVSVCKGLPSLVKPRAPTLAKCKKQFCLCLHALTFVTSCFKCHYIEHDDACCCSLSALLVDNATQTWQVAIKCC